jgi:glutathione synthase/RimK-type ligase-like ATP-grasp enzyme
LGFAEDTCMGKLIGLFTSADDPHLKHLIPALKKRDLPFTCFDRADFPQSIRLTARFESSPRWQGMLIHEQRQYALEDIHSILYRRPTAYRFIEGLSANEQEFARLEATRGFEGVLQNLPCLWLNHPDALRAAEWKPRQLRLAQEMGLRVPKTMITNDPQQALQFFEECRGEVVYKTLSVPPTFSGRADPSTFETIFTTKLTYAHFHTNAGSIANTAHLFQEYIPKAVELRVNIIGQQVFAAAIHSQASERTHVDWRRCYADLTYSTHTLPDHIREACYQLLAHLHVSFAAIDLIVTPAGEYIFLEANCNGQWGWIETATGQPLADAFVNVLAEGITA